MNSFSQRVLVVMCMLMWTGTALAVPAAVPYIGYLSDGDGPFDGTVSITVEMFDQADGGTSFWGPEEFTEVDVESGVFTVVLGAPSGPELDTLVLPEEGAWLEFTIDGTLLEPRQEMLSVPYALWAESADACSEAESLSGDEGAVTAADLAAKNHNHDSVYVNEGQPNGVTEIMLAPDSVTGAKVNNGSLGIDDFGDSGCSDGQVIKWVSGSDVWICANDLGGGGAEYTAGAGLNLVGSQFSVVATTIEGWAKGVCYDTTAELVEALTAWDQDKSDDLTTATIFTGDAGGTWDALSLGIGVVTDGNVSDVGWDKLTGVPSGLGDGDDDTTYTAGTGLNLVGSQFSAVQSTIEGWATGVCYHTPTELAEALPGWDQDVADDLTPDDLALVASSGSYEDLTDQPDLSPFATKSDTYTKDEVDQAIAQAVAAAIQGLDDCPSDMVQVGDFCIDRYETSLWTRNSGEPVDCGVLQAAVDEAKASGWTAQELYEGLKVADCGVGALAMCDYRQHGSEPGCTNNAGCDDYPDGFPNNGNWTVPVYACAIEGVGPSRSLTWFQAQQACVLSGRRLCFDSEWQAAAAGTPDPVAIVPVAGTESCNIWPNSKPGERDWATENQSVKTQSEAACVSNHGAYDMVGNLWEWTADWWGQGGDADDGNQPNDGDFHGDGYWNVDNAQSNGTYDEGNPVFPASARRGGSWDSGSTAGVFALLLNYGPANWHHGSGARCCRRK